MRIPLPLLAVGGLAVLLVGVVFVFLLLAAVRLFFALIELFAGVLIVGVAAFVIWKLFFQKDRAPDA